MDNFFSLNGCLAVKQGEFEKAKLILQNVTTLNDKFFIQTVKDIFLMVIRRHNENLLEEWFEIVDARLKTTLAKDDMFANNQDFLEAMLFAICDHRLENLHDRFYEYVAIFQSSCQDVWNLKNFYVELGSLAARMSMRKWDKQAMWLLEMIFDEASKRSDLKFLQQLLYHIDMNSIMYAKNFSAGTMYILYRKVQCTYMHLLDKIADDNLDQYYKKEVLIIALRGERNLMSNLARITMQDEMDIYDEWYDHMIYLFGKDEKFRPLAIMLVQMTITYWNRTQPKSSRKQVRYLEKILLPSYIKGTYAELLEEIC